MASSYSTSLGIEKMATGDQSGAWGTTSNHNWDIIDRITAYTSVAITTNADTATLTVREASPGSGTENLQDGMYRVIKFTGALDSTCTVTIAPNTAKVFFIIINATTDSGSSGPYSIILTQGSGANVTVQNGNNAVIYCDGAGSGAVVTDALSDLQIGNDLSLVSDSAVLNMGADNDITITHVADVGLKLKQAGATGDGSPFVLTLQTGELDIAAADVLGQIDFQAPDEATGTAAILVAAGIAAISEGDFSSSSNATKLSFKTASTAAAAETMSLSSAGLLTVADDIVFKDGGTIGVTSATDAMTVSSAGIVTFKDDILIKDGGTIGVTSATDAMTVSSAGIVTFKDDILIKDGGTIGVASATTAMTVSSAGIVTFVDDILLKTGGTIGNAATADLIHLATAETVFNEGGSDIDFRVEGDTNANLLHVNAGSNSVGIGTNESSDLEMLEVRDGTSAGTAYDLIRLGGAGNKSVIQRMYQEDVSTSAVTIATETQLGSGGGMTFVSGGASPNQFSELVVWCVSGGTPAVVGSVEQGSPSARTYSQSGVNLQVAIGTGTIDMNVTTLWHRT